MRKGGLFCFCLLVTAFWAQPGAAVDKVYRVEVLQVTSVEPYNSTYKSFISELAKNGLIQGKNLSVNRTAIDFDVEKAGLWKKIKLLMRIRSEAARIVQAKPDLVLTIGTPATKYAKDRIIEAGIPLVFSDVAMPAVVGCRSLTEAGPGFTGSTLYMDMSDALRIMRMTFPAVTTFGMIHSEDENAVAQTEEVQKAAKPMGLTVLSRQVGKNEHITPYARDLVEKGVQAFIIPLDTYYGMRNNEAVRELKEIRKTGKDGMILGISLVSWKLPGCTMYVGTDFSTMGTYSGGQAARILLAGAKPESLPVMRQKEVTIMLDHAELKETGRELPWAIRRIARNVN